MWIVADQSDTAAPDLPGIREMLAKATPGPWVVNEYEDVEAWGYGVAFLSDPYPNEDGFRGIDGIVKEADAELTARAPTLIAQLCDALEREFAMGRAMAEERDKWRTLALADKATHTPPLAAENRRLLKVAEAAEAEVAELRAALKRCAVERGSQCHCCGVHDVPHHPTCPVGIAQAALALAAPRRGGRAATLAAQIEAVRELHQPRDELNSVTGEPGCRMCWLQWPCPTIAALGSTETREAP
jgi:hypothetical protein